jgi:hypothetical protein
LHPSTAPAPRLLTAPRAPVITRDDFIGATSIDLEDRLFEPAWVALGQAEQTPTRLAPKPIEWRDLWAPSSKTSQGAVRLWVDVLTPDQAVKYPPIDIKPPPPRGYQLRAIVWKAEGMDTGDTMSGMNDLKFCGWMLDGKGNEMKQWTDVHWRAKRGKGSFNWRMVWDVALPRKFFYFTVQAWDQDVMKVRRATGGGWGRGGGVGVVCADGQQHARVHEPSLMPRPAPHTAMRQGAGGRWRSCARLAAQRNVDPDTEWAARPSLVSLWCPIVHSPPTPPPPPVPVPITCAPQYSDCLGESHLDLGPHVRRALRQPTKALQILRTDSDVMKAKRAKLEEQVRGGGWRWAAHALCLR